MKRGVILSTARSKDAVNQHKRNSIRKINRLLEGYIIERTLYF